ncbi:hypothetical protein [Ensifer adhaerens]|uniref:hypothetical protein n=1 Tax=Ensifer adhaerens TaxID=106592 RepID=UPI00098FCD90|nr:hypothetical protein [Ensifer adhaerens]
MMRRARPIFSKSNGRRGAHPHRFQLPGKLAHVVYLDAEVPQDRQSLFDLNGPDFRSEMEIRAQRYGNGWLASFRTADEMDEGERGWVTDDRLRRWYVEKLAASPSRSKLTGSPFASTTPKLTRWPEHFFGFRFKGSSSNSCLHRSLSVSVLVRGGPISRLRPTTVVRWLRCGPLVAPSLVADALMRIPAQRRVS